MIPIVGQVNIIVILRIIELLLCILTEPCVIVSLNQYCLYYLRGAVPPPPPPIPSAAKKAGSIHGQVKDSPPPLL